MARPRRQITRREAAAARGRCEQRNLRKHLACRVAESHAQRRFDPDRFDAPEQWFVCLEHRLGLIARLAERGRGDEHQRRREVDA